MRGLLVLCALVLASLGCARTHAAPGLPPVFLGAADARAVLARRDRPIVAAALAALDADAQATLKRGVAPPPVTGGCDLRSYIAPFSYEYGGGAARAAGLATYAYLHSLSAAYGSDAAARAAADQAQAIVLAWARDGFRKPDRTYREHPADFCDGDPGTTGRGVVDGIGLEIGRGMPDYVHAVDMLERIGRLDPAARADVLGFLRRTGNLIREASDVRAGDQKLDCNRYSNHTSVALAAMVAIARATGDEAWRRGLMASAPGAAAIGWSTQVDHAVYGRTGPALSCYRKPPGDSLWQPPVADAGEVADRYRQKPGQTFGYITFSLYNLMKPLLIDEVAGGAPDDAAAARQRLALALDYYAHYLDAIGPDGAIVTAAQAAWPGGDAYLGKVVSSPDCGSESGADHELYPYVAGVMAHVPTARGRALLARIAADPRCPTRLSRLDPILIGFYARQPSG